MRAVIQRVSQASVSVDGEEISRIGHGLLILLGVANGDQEAQADWLAGKIAGLRIFEDENDKLNLSVQDIGGTLTHKVEIIRLFEAGYLEPEICRKLSLPHELSAVENYVQTYKNVVKLLERGFSPSEISGILSVSERLVQAYIPIVREHHPEILERNPYFQESTATSETPSTAT